MIEFLITPDGRVLSFDDVARMDPVPDGVWVPRMDDPEPIFSSSTHKKVTGAWTIRRDENGTPIGYGQTWSVVPKTEREMMGPQTKIELTRRMTDAENAFVDSWISSMRSSGVPEYERIARQWERSTEIDPFDAVAAQALTGLEATGQFTRDRIRELFAQ